MSTLDYHFEVALDTFPEGCDECEFLLYTPDASGTGDSPADYECTGTANVCIRAEQMERDAMITREKLDQAKKLLPDTDIETHILDGNHFVRVNINPDDGSVVGIIDADYKDGVSKLEAICVDEDYRGIGIGKNLVNLWMSDAGNCKFVAEFDNENDEMHLLMRSTGFSKESVIAGRARYVNG